MKGQEVLFSNKSDEWETPPGIITYLASNGYRIRYDLAATEGNKVSKDFTNDLTDEYLKSIRGFLAPTRCSYGVNVAYCNPPYSQCKKFVELIANSKIPCVMLLPARTCTKWFHDFIYLKDCIEIEFIKGRLKFSDNKNSAPFPSMLVYFRC